MQDDRTSDWSETQEAVSLQVGSCDVPKGGSEMGVLKTLNRGCLEGLGGWELMENFLGLALRIEYSV